MGLFLPDTGWAQIQSAWVFRDARSMPIFEASLEPDLQLHTAIRPLSNSRPADSIFVRPTWRDRLLQTDALVLRDAHSIVRINPAVNFSAGMDPLRENLCIQNTRGVHADGRIGKKI